MATKSRLVLFALIKGNKILVEKRPIQGFSNPQYLIPGGAIDTLENLEQALKTSIKPTRKIFKALEKHLSNWKI